VLQKKAELLQKWELKQSEKKKKKEINSLKKNLEAIERDKQRRNTKEEAKIKNKAVKGQNAIYREYSADEIATMNPAKRRRLEDLEILSK